MNTGTVLGIGIAGLAIAAVGVAAYALTHQTTDVEDVIDQYVNRYDSSRDGWIAQSEAVRGWEQEGMGGGGGMNWSASMGRLFTDADANRDALVGRDELRSIASPFSQNGSGLTSGEVDSFVRRYGETADGIGWGWVADTYYDKHEGPRLPHTEGVD